MSIISDISTISSSLNAIKEAIIDKGVTPSGNITTYAEAISQIQGDESGGGSTTKYGASVDTLLGDVDASGVLQLPAEQSDLIFTGVEDINDYVLHYKFYNSSVKSVSFPDLIAINGRMACYSAFGSCLNLISVSFPNLTTVTGASSIGYLFQNCTGLASISFPSLTTVTGANGIFSSCSLLASISFPNLTTVAGTSGLNSMCAYCTSLEAISFPSLSNINNSSVLSQAFLGCTSLENIYFNSLTTTSFGSTYTNQFNNLLQNTGTDVTHTLHFPSNLETIIQGLSGYPLFGGTSGYVVLAFDLPATS